MSEDSWASTRSRVTSKQARRIFECIGEAGARYLVVGGLAVVAHGFVRLTQDVDIVLELEPENVSRTMKALASIGYRPLIPVDPVEFGNDAIRGQWAREKNMIVFQMIDFDDPRTRLDIFIREPFDFSVEYARAFWDDFGGLKVPFLALDRLLEMKLASGRPQDLIDYHTLKEIRDE